MVFRKNKYEIPSGEFSWNRSKFCLSQRLFHRRTVCEFYVSVDHLLTLRSGTLSSQILIVKPPALINMAQNFRFVQQTKKITPLYRVASDSSVIISRDQSLLNCLWNYARQSCLKRSDYHLLQDCVPSLKLSHPSMGTATSTLNLIKVKATPLRESS